MNKSLEVKGSLNWMSPELLDFLVDENSVKSAGITGCKENDVFAAGCLFFTYLTGGVHPFGSGLDIVPNIKQLNAVNSERKEQFILYITIYHLIELLFLTELSIHHFAYDLIMNVMLRKEPNCRTNWMNTLHKHIFNLKPTKVKIFCLNPTIFTIHNYML